MLLLICTTFMADNFAQDIVRIDQKAIFIDEELGIMVNNTDLSDFGQGSSAMTFLLDVEGMGETTISCLLYTSPSPRDATLSRMPSSA